MISCQRCGQPLSPNTPTCLRCGAPVTPSAGWSQPQGGWNANPFGAGPATPYGAPPSPSMAYGAPQPPAQQPPRFSAGSLISDGDLPEWLRESADGHGAQPAQPAQPAAWGAPAQPAPGQGWAPAPEPQRPDIAAQHTIRQPVVGAPNPAAQNPFGQPPMGYPQQPYPQQAAPAGYPQQPAYPQQQPGYPQQQQQQPGYPQQQPQQPQPYPPAPVYGQQQSGYPQQPAYPQQPYSQQQPMPPASVNAFPAIEQAGTAYGGPQVGGMAGQALVNHQSLPNWLSGASGQPGMGQAASHAMPPSGMQARSLVDDQLLPKWLRDQPDDAGRANVSEWIGASAAQEPMPQFLNDAYVQAQVVRAPQPNPAYGGGAGGYGGYGDEAAMPDWLRAQAQPGAGVGPQAGPLSPAGAPQHPGGFAASDLIDPAALPDWVTGRAPAASGFAAQGWNAANPEPNPASAPHEPPYGQGYDQQGYDQQGYDQGFDQGYDQGQALQAPWGADNGQDDQAYGGQSQADQRYGRGQPLASDELPSWLRGVGAAPAAGGRMSPAAPAERNPWASAAEPTDSAAAWDEAEPWDEGDGQDAQGWGASSGWDDGRDSHRDGRSDGRSDGHDDRRMSGWGASESNAGWDESAPHRSRDGSGRRQRAQPDDQRGYADDRYSDERYPDDRYAAGQYADDDEPYDDYDEEPDERARGRGWLGFLRRDKR